MCSYVDVNCTKDILLLHFLKFINGLQFRGVQIQTDLKPKTTKAEYFFKSEANQTAKVNINTYLFNIIYYVNLIYIIITSYLSKK